MASDDDEFFTPKLGRLRDLGKPSSKRYLKRVLKAAGRKGRPKSHSAFTGRNIGRGYRAVAVQGTSAYPSFRQRRVIVKARFVKLAGAGLRTAKAHLRYIQRDGVGDDSEPGKLYDATENEVDGGAFLENGKDDRHQFRFIVSPEDAAELADMQATTRDLMRQMEIDLETKLDWVAVDHFNTDKPHTHIVVRGTDDTGQDLIIARDYISHGFRLRAQEIMTAELGPRQDHDIENALRREVSQHRLTSIDRALLGRAADGAIDMRGTPSAGYARLKHSLQLGRLEKLRGMELAAQSQPGIWQLSRDMEPTLRALGERGDIIKTMHAKMTRQGRPELSADTAIFRPGDEPDKTIVGRLLSKGLADEVNDRYYLIVEGVDGKTHYADIGQHADVQSLGTRSIVELTAPPVGPRRTDRTIADIAAKHDGLYSATLHTRHDPKATEEFIRTHSRRLEGLRRANLVQHFADGSWEIPANYLDAVETHTQRHADRAPMNVTTRSYFTLDAQITANGATWLDRRLLAREPASMSNTGFGAEVEEALTRRRAWLIAEGFARQTTNGIVYQRALLKTLEKKELTAVAETIAGETGKTFRPVGKGDRIEGVYARPLELASGKFALIEQSKEFSLVPWRAVLERARGQAVSGVVGGRGISWDIGRKRGRGIS